MKWWVAIMVCATCCSSLSLSAQPVLLEAPLVLHAPAHRGIWPAWYDGEHFWAEVEPLMEMLGYEIVASDSTELAVRDRRHAIRFAFAEERVEVNREVRHTGYFAMMGPAGKMLVTLDALQDAFGVDAVWDVNTLTLTLSSSATLFDPSQFGPRRLLDVEPPQKILFPRERVWLGGVHVAYSLAHQWHQERGRSFTPTARVTADLAGGTMRWFLSRGRSDLRYIVDIQRTWLTRVEATQLTSGGLPDLRVSNRPLHPRTVHREEVLSGTTIPHAIVRGKVFGTVTEQVQADQAGRFTVRHPVLYGSTEASVEVETLGGDPIELFEVNRLTPSNLLPAGKLEYGVTVSKNPAGEIFWGVSDRLTVGASASKTPETTTLRATVLPLPTMHVSGEVDVLAWSGRGSLRWWRPWGGVTGGYHLYKTPHRSQHWSSTLTFARDAFNIHARFLRQQAPAHVPLTALHSSLGWELAQFVTLRGGLLLRSSAPASFQPSVSYTLPFGKPRAIFRASAETAGTRIVSYQAGAFMSGYTWSTGVQMQRSIETGAMEIRGHLQLNTEWAWFDARAGWDEGWFSHSQTLRGTVMLGEDIRFGALYAEQTQAVIRLFTDSNLNGILDGGESLYLRHRLNVGRLATHHRANGEVIAKNLVPHEVYRVEIARETIIDPLLHPATGYRFAFVATPGRTRYIDIPLQPLPTISGQLTGWVGSYTVLQVHLQPVDPLHALDLEATSTLPVYQDGGFFAQLPPGVYQLTATNLLTGEVVAAAALDVAAGQNFPVIQLQP